MKDVSQPHDFGNDALTAPLTLIRPERLANRTLEMVRIPSPSGAESEMADYFASRLTDLGLRVEIDREFPESPSVIGHLGANEGRTLQLSGHLDTVPDLAAQQPERRDNSIFGRGASDMKSGLAALLEVLEAIKEGQLSVAGGLLVTAYGQHEETVPGRALHAPLRSLLRRGIKGDACIVPEGPSLEIATAGNGNARFHISFTRPGRPVHEVIGGSSRAANPLMAAYRFIAVLEERSRSWSHDEFVGPESFFIGSIRGGDYYNRIPTVADIRGTRRYPLPRTFDEARAELTQAAESAAELSGVEVQVRVDQSGQPYRLRQDEPIVQALIAGYEYVTGQAAVLSSMRYAGDVSQFVNDGSVPAVYYGTDQSTAHSDVEVVTIDAIERCARVLLQTAINYLHIQP